MMVSVADSTIKEILARRIAGEILFSNSPGSTLKKWRGIFNVTQTLLAKNLRISSSVVSDYENERRTPGARFIRRFVRALLSIDEARGGLYLREWARHTTMSSDAIIDVKEFPLGVKGRKIAAIVQGDIVACSDLLERNIYGYTILDSVKAIQTFSSNDAYRIFGTTTERALIFTNVTLGRSPMVAVRVHPLKPRMVILHGPKQVDDLAIRLAQVEQVPLILSRFETVDRMVIALNKLYTSITSKKMV